MNHLKKVHEEIGSDVDLEQFDKILTYATSKPFGFLTVDFNAKTPEQTFRCCYNEYLSRNVADICGLLRTITHQKIYRLRTNALLHSEQALQMSNTALRHELAALRTIMNPQP